MRDAYFRQMMDLGEKELVLEAREPGAGSRTVGAKVSDVELPQSPEVPTAGTAPGSRLPALGGPPMYRAGLTIESPPTSDLFTRDAIGALTSLEAVGAMVEACRKCSLGHSRNRVVPGEGSAAARLVIVGEAPGATEDETGRPFVGRAGQLLNDILTSIGLAREDVFICNVLKCRPPLNRDPEPLEAQACSPYLHRQLELIRPKVILALGKPSATTLLNVPRTTSLGDLRGQVHRYRGTPLVVTYHPAALLRNPHWKPATWDDVRIARRLLDGEPLSA